MKRNTIIIVLLFLMINCYSQNTVFKYYHNFTEARSKAQLKNLESNAIENYRQIEHIKYKDKNSLRDDSKNNSNIYYIILEVYGNTKYIVVTTINNTKIENLFLNKDFDEYDLLCLELKLLQKSIQYELIEVLKKKIIDLMKNNRNLIAYAKNIEAERPTENKKNLHSKNKTITIKKSEIIKNKINKDPYNLNPFKKIKP